ncbi:hypothetical protein [Sphingomicrobium marinum]|uniref:hypothetical protein n=1 Tax=Sphingomicrobium marinum TaxID=1227950 RepID=UPI00223ECBD7|nr:hypothetical protein [Sphingomicrobium marinum]
MTPPECVKNPQRARLFPVLADTSKEGRSTSILLASMVVVRELSERLLGSVGQRIGSTARIHTYTEIEFECAPREKNLGRPDGLIVVDVGKRRWTALLEAKVGNAEIGAEQVGRYLELAKKNKIDAVITLSNQFSAVPQHHPLAKQIKAQRGVELYHWSWMHILTETELLYQNKDVADRDQAIILGELRRFLAHDSSGVKGFDRMPSSWTQTVNAVLGGATLAKSTEVSEVAEAWQQECKDLCLILSRQLNCEVQQKLPRDAANNPEVRFDRDVARLCSKKILKIDLDIPDAASLMNVTADLRSRNILVSMSLPAPKDRKSNKARLNWLLRQLPEGLGDDVHVRIRWPKTSPMTQYPLPQLLADPDLINDGKKGMQCVGFELVQIADMGSRFGSQRPFIETLEMVVPKFYDEIGQGLRAWQALPPKVDKERDSAAKVSPSALAEDAESDVLELRNELPD